MSKVLVITASPRGERSVSRALTLTFAQLWRKIIPRTPFPSAISAIILCRT